VAQLAAKDAPPLAQILVYPAVDRRRAWPSMEKFSTGFFLTSAGVTDYYDQYAPRATRNDDDPRLNPLAAADLRGLAPALVVTAGFDPLRDEGEAYAGALAKAGNRVVLRRFPGLVHGFFNMCGVGRACRAASVELAGAARVLLTASNTRPTL
jgi:acetyl esterase